MIRLLHYLLALLLPFAALAQAPPPVRPSVILISVDGLRADYLKRGLTPHINALAARGVTTRAMHPSFPSLTFPNHYTLVTGMRPDRHGIVNNNMEDPALGKFSLSNRDAVGNGRWWDAAEPIWVTAEKAGIATATMFWPGSEAEIKGIRPSLWLPFDGNMPEAKRVDQVLAWLQERPGLGLATLYFDSVDHEGHVYGPDSPEVNSALAEVDRQIGRLVAGLQAQGVAPNIVLVADHGMAQVADDRRIFLSKLLPADSFRLVAGGAMANIAPAPGQEAMVAAALLARHPHMQCWRKANVPRRLHFGRNPRVPAFVCDAEIGWMIWASPPRPDQKQSPLAGMHGYDPAHAEMDAAFVAAGPAFKPGTVLKPFDNVAIQPLLLHLMGLPPMRTDGSIKPLRKALH